MSESAATEHAGRRPKRGGTVTPIRDTRPVIQLGVALHRIVEEAVEALAQDPDLYQRDGMLVHVLRACEPERDIAVTPDTPQIRAMIAAALRLRLTRWAIWEKYDKRSDDWIPAVPPDTVLLGVLALGEWPGIRHLDVVVEAPALRPDGSLLTVPGYDLATRCLFAPNATYPL